MYGISGILGVVLMAAPFILGYGNDPAALYTSIGIGLALTVAAIFEWAAEGEQRWEYWILGIAGLAAVTAPFILGFNFMTMAAWTMMLTGFISMGVAGFKLFPGKNQY